MNFLKKEDLENEIESLILKAENSFLSTFETLSVRMSLASSIVEECKKAGEINPLPVNEVFSEIVKASPSEIRHTVSKLRA